MVSKGWKIAAGVVGVVGGGLAVGLGPVVRYEVRRVAAGYGAMVEIDQVRPAWTGVRLVGVVVRLEGAPSIDIRLNEIAVNVGRSERRIALYGGTVAANGPRSTVLRELEAWRAARGARPGGGGAGGDDGRRVEVQGLDLVWRDRLESPTESVSARGVDLVRAAEKTSIAAQEATLSSDFASVVVRGGRLVVDRQGGGYRVERLSASSVDADIALPAAAADSSLPSAAEDSPRPAAAINGKGGTDAPAQTRPAQVRPIELHPRDGNALEHRGVALRDALLRGAAAVDLLLSDGAAVDVAGVTARLRRGDDKLGLGPGKLSVLRDAGALIVELSPGDTARAPGDADQQALTFRLRLPLANDPAAPQDITADVRGGPIWLSTLGVHDGDLGLFDVGHASVVSRARVVLSADGQSIGIDGEGRLKNLSLHSAALSDEPVAGLDLAWRAKGQAKLDGSRIMVEDGELDLGAIRLIASGAYERSGGEHRVRGDFELPLSACQSMLDSVPKGLVSKLQGMRLAGSFGVKGKLRFDTASLDRGFVLNWGLSNTCRVVEVPAELNVDRFKRTFRRWVYGPDGQRVEIESGPGTATWVRYDDISRFMEVAVLTTEDGRFPRHHGFDEEAIKNSIRENLRKRRFVRGASTISMQLAKNLYLERTKSVARKLQEALLTMYLEQELTKEQLMELYLNVVEFGPMVYGVGAAAEHYFNTTASQLSLGQALYIASILPNPNVQHFEAGGPVTPMWSEYLRKLMRIAYRRQHITETELEAGLLETVVRGSPAPQLAPGPPPGSRVDDVPDDDQGGAWESP